MTKPSTDCRKVTGKDSRLEGICRSDRVSCISSSSCNEKLTFIYTSYCSSVGVDLLSWSASRSNDFILEVPTDDDTGNTVTLPAWMRSAYKFP